MRWMVFVLAAGSAFAQTDARPVFEAAFIKANTTGSGSSSSNGTKGQIVMVNQSLKRIVEQAYRVKPFQVIAPDWTENLRFDITAKYPEGTKNSDRPAMLRALLEDRFKLAAHTESREAPGFALVVTKGGLKIQPATETSGGGTSSNSSDNLVNFKGTAITLAEFGDYLARRLGSAVIDPTGDTAKYTFELRWQLDDPNGGGAVDRGAGEFAAIQDAIATLGLHLRAQKVPVETVVVDHLERVPTEN
jgi:uncharacterized protein (TIGR03435 family)